MRKGMINTIGIGFHFILEFYIFILQFILILFKIISHYSTSLFLKLHDFTLNSCSVKSYNDIILKALKF